MAKSFTMVPRDPEFFHWDVNSDCGREFAIRGEPGCYVLQDRRNEQQSTRDGMNKKFPPRYFATHTEIMGVLMEYYKNK